jgi:hypothetical protein
MAPPRESFDRIQAQAVHLGRDGCRAPWFRVTPSKRYRRWDPLTLLVAILGAEAWGLFFATAPILDVLFCGAPVWMPLFIWREWRRSRRDGFLPGIVVRAATIGGVLAIASVAPVKYLDQRVGPFPAKAITLGQLSPMLPPTTRLSIPEPYSDRTVVLPPTRLRLSEFIDVIERQTGLRHHIGYCGNSMSILWGGHPIGGIQFETE